jgi:hypothetical protein
MRRKELQRDAPAEPDGFAKKHHTRAAAVELVENAIV